MDVKREREKRGWSKSELSRRTGIGLTEIIRIEKGQLPIYPKWRKRLVECFGITEVENDGDR
ncbi:MAG: helix-turn-helix transcriptional regulator [Pelotomaculum sp.]|nr:helix-turn-helix transcriptional regulator [Pelotomaculum sp.]